MAAGIQEPTLSVMVLLKDKWATYETNPAVTNIKFSTDPYNGEFTNEQVSVQYGEFVELRDSLIQR